MSSPTSVALAPMRLMNGFGYLHLCRNAGGSRRAPLELGQVLQQLRPEPLIAMGFRFRRSARLGPLRFNFGKIGSAQFPWADVRFPQHPCQ